MIFKRPQEMNEINTTNRGSGAGAGQGRGRMQGGKAMGAGGNCLCPGCGHRQPHKRGVPCTQVQCPKCKKTMIRE
ncbi:MAG TPA: hypothetical protein PKZ12_06785 [Smithellaceae bacterium]|nr:hypothetical protein [Smithellaceae bacterium]